MARAKRSVHEKITFINQLTKLQYFMHYMKFYD